MLASQANNKVLKEKKESAYSVYYCKNQISGRVLVIDIVA